MILGIDVRESAVVAIACDETGAIIQRIERDGDPISAAADAARAAGATPDRVGIAMRDPGDAAASDLAAAVAGAARVSSTPRLVTKGGATALAEHALGAARGARHVVALTADDRVHAGVVIDGRLFEGAHGAAGAAAWLALNPVERDDYRRLGCLEAEVGAAGIVRRLVWRIKAGDTSRVLEMAGGQLGDISVRHVFDAARQGDGVSIAVVRDTARYVGMAIGNLIAILDPEIVVLGGLIAEAADLLVEPSKAEAARRIPAGSAAAVQILSGTLGADAAAVGAALAAR